MFDIMKKYEKLMIRALMVMMAVVNEKESAYQ